MESCGRLVIGLSVGCTVLQEGRLPIGLQDSIQDSILPHKLSRILRHQEVYQAKARALFRGSAPAATIPFAESDTIAALLPME